MRPVLGQVLMLMLVLLQDFVQLSAEIAHTPLASNRISQVSYVPPPSRCPQRLAFDKILGSIDDVEDLYVDVPIHIALVQRQKKRPTAVAALHVAYD
ncbi:hypothetical protein AWZ03_013773 [Drosophila navojoa]|uniref:Secreted protein n=1 Tax=Drosophila navojoa TaxID=7232 RepID=A0A484AUT5_DRONA|nr:hypothetical protein AWZ03_013773 [Drosophila navojoa]